MDNSSNSSEVINSTIIIINTYNTLARQEFTSLEDISLRISQGIIAILVIFSIITNAIVIRIFLSKKFGRVTGAKILYANISLSDELFLFTCILQASIYGSECNGNCRTILSYATHISGFVSTYTMVLIAFKRYQAIAFPLQNNHQNNSPQNWTVFLGLGIIWTFSILISFLFIKYVDVPHTDSSFFSRICSIISNPVKASYDKPYFSLIAMVLIPLVFGLFFSLMAIYSLKKSSSTILNGNLRLEQINAKRKQFLISTIMILAVIVGFTICWLPITVFYTFERLHYKERKHCDYNYLVYAVFSGLLMVSFIINPIIYWFMNPDFRKGFRSILHLFPCCR